MKVILFIGQLSTGGAERQIINLANGLSSFGDEINLITIFPGGTLVGTLNKSSHLKHTSIWKKKAESKIARFFQYLFSSVVLRNLISRMNPDVVYSFLFFTNIAAWLATRGSYANKLVWGLRSTKMKLSWKQYFPDLFSKIVSSTVPLIIVNSESGLKFFLDRGYNPQNIISIPNGIDVDYFNILNDQYNVLRKKLGLSTSDIVVGHIARHHPIKNHLGFIDASLRLLGKYSNIYFVLVGRNINELNSLLMDSIPNNQKGRYCFLGEQKDIPQILNSLDLFCSSSESEGFPNVIAEAMACGVPCIVTDVGDSARIVNDPACVVPPGDPEALARAIDDFISANHLQDHKSRLRERIVDNFSIDAMVQRTIEAFIKYLPDIS